MGKASRRHTQMHIALIDSGRGQLPTAHWINMLAPEVELSLCSDPVGSPWGQKTSGYVIGRVLALAHAAINEGAQAIALACNTASVTAMATLRAELEPDVPVIGTVPAVKPAAQACASFAVWATSVTIASGYLQRLVSTYAGDADVALVACAGLAHAIEGQDSAAIDAAIVQAVAQTPAATEGIVLGCTHYPIVADRIAAAMPGRRLFDSSEAVARQVLRRLSIEPTGQLPEGDDAALAASGIDSISDIRNARALTLG